MVQRCSPYMLVVEECLQLVAVQNYMSLIMDYTYGSCWADLPSKDSCGLHSYCYAWMVRLRSFADSQCRNLVVVLAVAKTAAGGMEELHPALGAACSSYLEPSAVVHCDPWVVALLQPAAPVALVEDNPTGWRATAGHPVVAVVVHSSHFVAAADMDPSRSSAAAVAAGSRAA